MFVPTIPPGSVPALSGVYFTNLPPNLMSLLVNGVVATIGQANDGPIAQWTPIGAIGGVADTFGSGTGVKVAQQAFVGGAVREIFWRLGGGSPVAATKNLTDDAGTPATVGHLDARFAGNRVWAYTIVDDLLNTTKVALNIYRDGILADTIRFSNYTALGGAGGIGEAQALANALATAGTYLTFTKTADGNKHLARVVGITPLTGGVNPVPDGAALQAALDSLTGQGWNVAVFDTEDTVTNQPTIIAWTKQLESRGIYATVVLGDNTGARSAKNARAVAANAWNLRYVTDQFTDEDGVVLDGADAAGRVAGLVAAAGIKGTIGGAVLTGSKGGNATLPTPLSRDDVTAATQSGAITFQLDAFGHPSISEDVTAYVTPGDGIHDPELWSQGYVVARFYKTMQEIGALWSGRVRKVENNRFGWATVVGDANSVINDMTAQQFLQGGGAIVSQVMPPSGRTAWIEVTLVVQQKLAQLIGVLNFG